MIREQSNKKPSGKFSPPPKLPLIDPGAYMATIKDWELHRQYDRTKILIHIDVDVCGRLVKLTYFVSTKIDANGQIQEPTGTMKLYKMLKNLWPQSLFSEIDLDELVNMRCNVIVDTVKRDSQRVEKPSEKQYSAIREILSFDCSHEKVHEPWEEDDDISR